MPPALPVVMTEFAKEQKLDYVVFLGFNLANPKASAGFLM